MKTQKTLLALAILITSLSFGQINTFPATGNVGIGTTTDNNVDKLQVNGSLRSEGLTVSAIDITTPITLGGFQFTTDWSAALKVNGFNRMTFNSGESDVHFNGKIYTSSINMSNASIISEPVIGSSAPGIKMYGYDGIQLDNRSYYNAPTTFSFNGIEKVRISNNSLLIGTTTDNNVDKLQVNGSIYSTNLNLPSVSSITLGNSWGTGRLSINNSGTEFLVFDVPNGRVLNNLGRYLTSSSSTSQFGSYDNYAATIVTNNIERLRVTENGNVGIGTTNPTSKLTVAGNISSREVKVTVDAGADFVFEKEYHLPSLASLDAYIKENKHLPEIASAKEMQKNGINLSEMNIKLLQKIEELTLYTIEQNKKLKEQNERIEKQNNKIEEQNKEFSILKEKIKKIELSSSKR